MPVQSELTLVRAGKYRNSYTFPATRAAGTFYSLLGQSEAVGTVRDLLSQLEAEPESD